MKKIYTIYMIILDTILNIIKGKQLNEDIKTLRNMMVKMELKYNDMEKKFNELQQECEHIKKENDILRGIIFNFIKK